MSDDDDSDDDDDNDGDEYDYNLSTFKAASLVRLDQWELDLIKEGGCLTESVVG